METHLQVQVLVLLLQPVDAETQKSMMAFYHKKQEEQKVTGDACVLPCAMCDLTLDKLLVIGKLPCILRCES